MKRTLAIALLCAAHAASAESRHVLVLRAEGNANAEARGKIDTQVLKLAKSIQGNVEAGDISFTDAAAAVGCSPTDAPCRDEVLATMGVDEIVVTLVTASGSELKISVKRISKGAPPKEASTAVPSNQPADAKMNSDIGPLFGLVQAAPDKTPPKDDKATAAAALGASLAAKNPTETKAPEPTPVPPPTTPPTTTTPDSHTAEPPKTAQADTNVTAAPNGQVVTTPEGTSDNRRLEMIGMATGGGLVVAGMVCWLVAGSAQADINSAPTNNPTDFKNLRDLESRGDTFAAIGNIAFIGGLAVGGVSAFFYWRDRDSHSTQQARLAPAVFPHGGGVTLTIGGAR